MHGAVFLVLLTPWLTPASFAQAEGEPTPAQESTEATGAPTPTSEPAAAPEPAESTPAPEPAAPVPSPEEQPPPAQNAPTRTSASGVLWIDSRPWSYINLDGFEIGKTPFRSGPLGVGEHTLDLVTEDGRIRSMDVQVDTEVRTRICWNFDLEQDCEEGEDASAPPFEDMNKVAVHLVDGQIVVGRIDPSRPETGPLRLWLTREERLSLDRGAIVRILPIDEAGRRSFAFANPAASRHMLAPSAIPLGKGQGIVSQKALLFTEVLLGVDEYVTIQAGTVVPGLLYGMAAGDAEALSGSLGLRLALPITPAWHIGVGGDSVAGLDRVLGHGFFHTTFGRADGELTLGIGVAEDILARKIEAYPAIIAGNLRLSDGMALVGEGWFLLNPALDDVESAVIGTSLRLLRRSFTADLGTIQAMLDGVYTPLPWLEVSWSFRSGSASSAP